MQETMDRFETTKRDTATIALGGAAAQRCSPVQKPAPPASSLVGGKAESVAAVREGGSLRNFQARQEYPCNKPLARGQTVSAPRLHCREAARPTYRRLGAKLAFDSVCVLAVRCCLLPLVSVPNHQCDGRQRFDGGIWLGAGDLGLLTSVYYLTFAAAQISIGILLDRYGPGQIQSAVMVAAALGAALFAVSDNFWLLLGGRALIGLGVAASLTAGLKALVLWFPKEPVPLLNGLMIMLGAMGAVTATLPVEFLLVSVGWRALFALLAIASAGCALVIYLVVPEMPAVISGAGGPARCSLKAVYADPRFWRLAPLSATCVGTSWALQGLWAAPWLSDVEGLDRHKLLQHLLVMAIALSSWGRFCGASRSNGCADVVSNRGRSWALSP